MRGKCWWSRRFILNDILMLLGIYRYFFCRQPASSTVRNERTLRHALSALVFSLLRPLPLHPADVHSIRSCSRTDSYDFPSPQSRHHLAIPIVFLFGHLPIHPNHPSLLINANCVPLSPLLASRRPRWKSPRRSARWHVRHTSWRWKRHTTRW